jgi:hypothetical protein
MARVGISISEPLGQSAAQREVRNVRADRVLQRELISKRGSTVKLDTWRRLNPENLVPSSLSVLCLGVDTTFEAFLGRPINRIPGRRQSDFGEMC